MTKRNESNDLGITLIALVVTIIVLMILAGIAVATLMGDNGIIKRAGEAKEAQRGATVQDEVTLAIAENEMIDQLNSVNGGQENKKTKTDVVNELVTKGYLTSDDATTLETEDEITIGSVRIDFSGLSSAAGGGNNPQPGQSGYAGGSYNAPYIPFGFTHTGSEDWNHGYTITGNVGTENENDQFVWVPCSTEETPPIGVVKFEKITTGKYGNSNQILHPTGGTNQNVANEDSTVAEIRTSVGTFGGFYIAKYEAGIEGTTDNNSLNTKTATDRSVKPLSQAGVGVWNSISREDSLTVAKAMIDLNDTGCKSTLISGECWDTTLAWITETADSDYAGNSEGKGWYNDVSSNQIHTTGYYGTNNTNKIFDMGGNVWELTSENCLYDDGENTFDYPVTRGGGYYYSGSDGPASSRSYSDGSFYADGFRVVIYK